jgi:hypothetical protein
MAACGMTAPVGSATVPVNTPGVDELTICACPHSAASNRTNSSVTREHGLKKCIEVPATPRAAE